jgi:hydroxyacylglutathione hydrolase
MDSVITIPALGDNFIYLYRYNQNYSLAVDPCDSSLVLKTLQKQDLSLKIILITHHHWDHIAGVDELKRKTTSEGFPAPIRLWPMDRFCRSENEKSA